MRSPFAFLRLRKRVKYVHRKSMAEGSMTGMTQHNEPSLEPETWIWDAFLREGIQDPKIASLLEQAEHRDRTEDAKELAWLLRGIRRELGFYKYHYHDSTFDQELAVAFGSRLDSLERRAAEFIKQPAACLWDAYLTLKYEVRKLYKQLGGIVSGSDWQTPGKHLHPGEQDLTDEAGFTQEEEGTYQRCYGSEAVKQYEVSAMNAWYGITAELSDRCALFLTTSGMKALELAIASYKTFAGETYPCFFQQGFYGEGTALASLLLHDAKPASPEDMYRMLESSEPLGCLIVDPGKCWPVRPAVDLGKLFDALERHRQQQPLYIIVDRTLTSIANPLFERYAQRLPPHVVLISVESGIKYLQYGFDLANVGYLVVHSAELATNEGQARWIELLSILDAGATPLTVRQLPVPDRRTIVSRLSRMNRNARWMDAFLRRLAEQGAIRDYSRSVDPTEDYILDDRPWIGSVFYIRLPGELTEREYEAWIDACVRAAPPDMHLISGGSFGFDTVRLNAVHGDSPEENALRLSVGRAPLAQFLATIKTLSEQLLHPFSRSCV